MSGSTDQYVPTEINTTIIGKITTIATAPKLKTSLIHRGFPERNFSLFKILFSILAVEKNLGVLKVPLLCVRNSTERIATVAAIIKMNPRKEAVASLNSETQRTIAMGAVV